MDTLFGEDRSDWPQFAWADPFCDSGSNGDEYCTVAFDTSQYPDSEGAWLEMTITHRRTTRAKVATVEFSTPESTTPSRRRRGRAPCTGAPTAAPRAPSGDAVLIRTEPGLGFQNVGYEVKVDNIILPTSSPCGRSSAGGCGSSRPWRGSG